MKLLPKYNPFKGKDETIAMAVIAEITILVLLFVFVRAEYFFAAIVLILAFAIAGAIIYCIYRTVRYMYVGK